MSTPQRYENHRRYVPMYHIVLFGLAVATLIGSCVNLLESLGDHQRLYSASLLVVTSVILLFLFFFGRSFFFRVGAYSP